MKKFYFLLLLSIVVSSVKNSFANFISATSANYTSFLGSLVAGDTLYLAPGNYMNGLTLSNRNGTAAQPIVIMGSSNLYTTVFKAQSCCNTVSLTQCSYLVIKNLELDGLNLPVDAVKAEGTAGNYTHHITIEYLNIINHGNFVQIVGINTKCPSWDWAIRKNRIVGAGTGIYLGGSGGDKPFVNGTIEYNFIANTLGYNMQIKHQTDTVRDDFPGTMINAKTTIRHNVFCKELNGETGGNARPNLLVGGFPLNGWGSTDYYEIYGNFFYQNPNEAMFQGTGNIMLYKNIFVNHTASAGFPAITLQSHNGVAPQDIKVFHNTVWANNSTGGIRMLSPNSGYQQYCFGNAVFSASPLSSFGNSGDNVTDSYANAITYVLSATANLSTLDLYPKSGQLTGSFTNSTPFQNHTWWNKDFNNTLYNWSFRGAYGACCNNPGWHLQLDTMPTFVTVPTAVADFNESLFEVNVFPNPAKDILTLTAVVEHASELNLKVINGAGQMFKKLPGSFSRQHNRTD
jgi:hypothetical protein